MRASSLDAIYPLTVSRAPSKGRESDNNKKVMDDGWHDLNGLDKGASRFSRQPQKSYEPFTIQKTHTNGSVTVVVLMRHFLLCPRDTRRYLERGWLEGFDEDALNGAY